LDPLSVRNKRGEGGGGSWRISTFQNKPGSGGVRRQHFAGNTSQGGYKESRGQKVMKIKGWNRRAKEKYRRPCVC